MKNLADFKRALATDGTIITLLENTAAPQPPEHLCWQPRSVAKIQTNAVAFLVGDVKWWLYFEKAADWSFDGDIAINTKPRGMIKYRVTVPDAPKLTA